jgi:hypothetical protein
MLLTLLYTVAALAAVVGAIAALLTVGITSVFHNGRLSDIDMKRRFPSMG